MCGIYGVSRTTRITELMNPVLALAMSGRGTDSWGVTDGDYIYKTKGSINDEFVDCGLEAPVYHTRAASVGAATERNAHPFRFDHNGKTVVGVHNGHIQNWWALKDKYERKELEVDSEHIFLHLVEGKPLSDLSGYGAVVWYEYPTDKPEERVRYFSRFNHEALYFAKLRSGEIVFASTKKSIEQAAIFASAEIDFFYDTEPKIRYIIEQREDNGHDELRLYGTLPWAEAPIAYQHNTAVADTRGSHYRSDQCAVTNCYRMLKDKNNNLVCEYCQQEEYRNLFTTTV